MTDTLITINPMLLSVATNNVKKADPCINSMPKTNVTIICDAPGIIFEFVI